MTALVDWEASQNIELEAARIDDYEDVEVSSMSEDSDDERLRSKTTKSRSARASSSILSARFHHIPPVPRSSPPPPPSPKLSQSPAEQAPHVERAANLGHPDNPYPLSSDSSLWHALSHDWIWEQTFLLIAIMSLIAIVLILFIYNGHPVLDLPHVVTINAILAIFSTSLTAALSVPLALSISQAKWNWFHDDQGGGKPLSDLEIYDQASRGPWGSLVMLGNIGWRHFSSLGAVIIVLTLASDCMIQQTISYELRLVASPSSRALSKPILPISLGYNDTGNTELRKLMAKAIRYALLGIPPESLSAAASCPSGECIWQAYDTLAVCSSCKNVTAKDPEEPSEGIHLCDEALFSPAVGPRICMFPAGPAPPTTRFFKVIYYFTPIVSNIGGHRKTTTQQTREIYDCSLSWCIRSFSSATSIGGDFGEVPRNFFNLTNINKGRIKIVSDGISSSSTSASSSHPPPAGGGNNGRNFIVDESSSYNLFKIVRQALDELVYLKNFFSFQYPSAGIGILNGNNENNSILADPSPVFENIANAISAQLRTVPFPLSSSSSSSSKSSSTSSSPSSSSDSRPLLNTTTTTTTKLLAPNTALYREPVLVVLWVWLAFPVFLLFGTAFFLLLVIFTARNPVWKDSLWPLLWARARPPPRQGAAMNAIRIIGQGQSQGQGQQGQQVQGWGYGLEDMKRVAGVMVRLQRDGRGGWGFTLVRQDGRVGR